jgi:uncharacterized protein (TIGR02246 family)
MIRSFSIIVATASLAGCQASGPPPSSQAPEQQIRALLDRWQLAFEKHDVAGAMSIYLPSKNVLVYGLSSTVRGNDALRQDYARFFARFKGPVHSELRDLDIAAGPQVAFSHYFQGISGTLQDGRRVQMWIRVTQGYRLVDGRWFAIHDHVSVPIDMKTRQARLDFTP